MADDLESREKILRLEAIAKRDALARRAQKASKPGELQDMMTPALNPKREGVPARVREAGVTSPLDALYARHPDTASKGGAQAPPEAKLAALRNSPGGFKQNADEVQQLLSDLNLAPGSAGHARAVEREQQELQRPASFWRDGVLETAKDVIPLPWERDQQPIVPGVSRATPEQGFGMGAEVIGEVTGAAALKHGVPALVKAVPVLGESVGTVGKRVMSRFRKPVAEAVPAAPEAPFGGVTGEQADLPFAGEPVGELPSWERDIVSAPAKKAQGFRYTKDDPGIIPEDTGAGKTPIVQLTPPAAKVAGESLESARNAVKGLLVDSGVAAPDTDIERLANKWRKGDKDSLQVYMEGVHKAYADGQATQTTGAKLTPEGMKWVKKIRVKEEYLEWERMQDKMVDDLRARAGGDVPPGKVPEMDPVVEEQFELNFQKAMDNIVDAEGGGPGAPGGGRFPFDPGQRPLPPYQHKTTSLLLSDLDATLRKWIWTYRKPAEAVGDLRMASGSKRVSQHLSNLAAKQLDGLSKEVRKAVGVARKEGTALFKLGERIPELTHAQKRALQHTFARIDRAGQRLVDAGILSAETFAKNKGKYLHRFYFRDAFGKRWVPPNEVIDTARRYLMSPHGVKRYGDTQLNVGRVIRPGMTLAEADAEIAKILAGGQGKHYRKRGGNSTATGGPGTIVRQRTDIPKPIRDLMGEVKDGVALAIETVSKVETLAANLEYFNKSAAQLDTMKAMNDAHPMGPDELVTMGEGKLLGKLANQEVPRWFAETVDDMHAATEEMPRLFRQMSIWFQKSKTVASFTGHARQFTSNVFHSVLAGNSIMNPDNLPHYIRALHSMRKQDGLFMEAMKHNAVGGFTQGEFRGRLNAALEKTLRESKAPGFDGHRLMNTLMDQMDTPSFNKAYDFWDNLFKLAAYSKARGGAGLPGGRRGSTGFTAKLGALNPGVQWSSKADLKGMFDYRHKVLDPVEASNYVNTFYINFEEKSTRLKQLTTPAAKLFVDPFLTVKYKSIPVWLNAARRNPGRVAALLGGMYVGMNYMWRLAGVDPEEIEAANRATSAAEKAPKRLSLQDFSVGKLSPEQDALRAPGTTVDVPMLGTFGFFPARDKDGNLEITDMRPHMPVGELLGEIVGRRPGGEGYDPNEPFTSNMMLGLVETLRDDFLNGPIMGLVAGAFQTEREEGKTFQRQVGEELGDAFTPLAIPQVQNVVKAGQGKGAKLGSQPDLWRAIKQNFMGIRSTAIDAGQQLRKLGESDRTEAALQADEGRVMRELEQAARDGDLTEEKKVELIQQYRLLIDKDIESTRKLGKP